MVLLHRVSHDLLVYNAVCCTPVLPCVMHFVCPCRAFHLQYTSINTALLVLVFCCRISATASRLNV